MPEKRIYPPPNQGVERFNGGRQGQSTVSEAISVLTDLILPVMERSGSGKSSQL